MEAAPLYNDVALGPADGAGFWLTAQDGTRLRAGLWNAGGPSGTVVLLPGRTEYVEKYGMTAATLAQAGYATLTLDFRGQGMSARALPDPMVGHVADFAEFQQDVEALLAFARAQSLPQPFYLLSHSMGGCIALRALLRPHPFRATAFSAPMWGIAMPAWQRPFARPGAALACALGFGHRYAPGTGPATYVVDEPFAGNTLTTDPAMWDYMKQQALAHPALSLGGPSFTWLNAALRENAALACLPSPDLPCLCALGSAEKIVDSRPIHARMPGWAKGKLVEVAGAEHEILMERPETRAAFLADTIALFKAN